MMHGFSAIPGSGGNRGNEVKQIDNRTAMPQAHQPSMSLSKEEHSFYENSGSELIGVPLEVEGKLRKCIMDTGSMVTLISENISQE